jgi:hypothetical protein
VVALVAGACGGEKAAPKPTRTPQLESWAGITDAPVARVGAASAVSDGLLYVAGGVGRTGLLASVAFYDPAVNAWTAAPDLPIALRDAAAVARGPEVVVLGGFTDVDSKVPSKRVFSLKGSEWRELASLAAPRGALGAAAVKDRIYAIGGIEANERVSARVEIFDGDRWRTGPALPTGRASLGVAAGDRYIYAIGGRSGTRRAADRARREVERFDTASNAWQRRAPLKTGRTGVAVLVGPAAVLALGGQDGAGEVLATVETYASVENIWSAFDPPMPVGLHSFAAGAIANAIVVATGGTSGVDGLTAQGWSLASALDPLIP